MIIKFILMFVCDQIFEQLTDIVDIRQTVNDHQTYLEQLSEVINGIHVQ